MGVTRQPFPHCDGSPGTSYQTGSLGVSSVLEPPLQGVPYNTREETQAARRLLIAWLISFTSGEALLTNRIPDRTSSQALRTNMEASGPAAPWAEALGDVYSCFCQSPRSGGL